MKFFITNSFVAFVPIVNYPSDMTYRSMAVTL